MVRCDAICFLTGKGRARAVVLMAVGANLVRCVHCAMDRTATLEWEGCSEACSLFITSELLHKRLSMLQPYLEFTLYDGVGC